MGEKVGLFRTTFRDGNMLRTSTTEGGWRKNPEEQQNSVRRLSVPKKREEKYMERMEEMKRRYRKRE